MKIDKLNIGCGDNFVKDWLNIGLFPGRLPPGLSKVKGCLVLYADITYGFRRPFNEHIKDVQYVYASHFIEHIAFKDARKFLKIINVVMQKGGVLRLSFPDLELWIKKYCEDDKEFFKTYKSTYLKTDKVKTKGEIFMSQVHNFGHKWCYDFESMEHILQLAGFKDIQKKDAFDSLIPEIKKLEPSEEGRLLESAYVECVK